MSEPKLFERYTADKLVKEEEERHYYWKDDQALFIIREVYSLGYRWDLIYGYDNSQGASDYETTIEYSYKTTTMDTKNDQISANIGLQLKGLSFEISGAHTTISERGITEEHKQTTNIKVSAGTKLYFYKKVFMFRMRTWFINDAWGHRWRVGGLGNYSPCLVENEVEHDTKNHVRVHEELKGSTPTDVTGITPAITFYKTRKFENCTGQCKNCIRAMRVEPPIS